MKKYTAIFISSFFLSFLQTSLAQTGVFYSPDNVLSNSLVNAIYQDKRNYIWVATEDGLNKFDGVRFTIYRNNKDDKNSLKNDYVRTVFEDSKGRFWVGCINGLMIYDRARDSFTEVPVYFRNKFFSPHVTSIIETKNGEIWMSTSGGGILRSTDDGKTFKVDENLFSRLCSRYLVDLYQDNDGNIWIASENQGLNLYLTKQDKLLVFKSPNGISSNQVSAICGDNHGNVYVGTLTGGLFVFDKKTQNFRNIPYVNTFETIPVKSLLYDQSKGLLVGTDGKGIKYYNEKRGVLEDYQLNYAIFNFNRTKIHALCKDNNGNLWVGLFQKGVFLSPNHPNKFSYWGAKSFYQNVIGNNCIMSVHKDISGKLWVGTDNDGIYCVTGNTSRHYDLKVNGISGTVMSMVEQNSNTLWLASYLDGLVKFDKNSGNFVRYPNNSALSFSNTAANKAMTLALDSQDRIWIGTNGAGVQVFDTHSSKYVQQYIFHEEDSTGIANNWVNYIKRDGDRAMWIGTYGGVSRIDQMTGKITNYSTKHNILPGNIVLAIEKAKNGAMWFGTTEGLCCFYPDKGTSVHYSTKDGLAGNVVCAIQEDEKGDLWISTHSGISRFNPGTKKFLNYYAFDGLQGNEFSNGASFRSADGELFFAGIGGVTSFYPREITNKAAVVQLYLTGLYVLDKKVVEGMKLGWHQIIDGFISDVDKIYLSYDDNMFSLEFSTFDFGNAESVSYRYLMEGLSEQWITTGKGVSKISFTNLNYGNYRLKVKALINGKESTEKDIEIIIYPPWYLSWPMKVLYFILLILGGFTIFRVARERLIHKQEMVRREHLEQVNEAKLQFFINISHEIRTPMSLIISPLEKLLAENKDPEKQAVYQLMYRNAGRILRLINQLLDIRKIDKGLMFVKMRKTEIVGFVDDLITTFEYQTHKTGVQLSFKHDMNELNAWIDINNFDKVLVNILSNAFKFTPAGGEIQVQLKVGHDPEELRPELRNYFEITVADTGIGIQEDKLEKIFERFYQIDNSSSVNFGTGIGLHLSKSLVELMHGRIVAQNRTDVHGTEFIIHLPLGDAHLTDIEKEVVDDQTFINKWPSSSTPLVIEPEETQHSKVKPKTKYKILIVDDEDEIRHYLRDELADTYKISECVNGKEAYEYVLKEKPDLIISDVMMPVMDGLELCKKIKSNINVNHIPVILLTAKSSDEDKAEGFETGADAYVAKPFNINILKKRVASTLENRQRIEYKSNGQNDMNIALVKPVVLKSNDKILMEKITKIITDNIAESDLNVEMLANGVGMSRVHMHRKLKELTNMSARDFIKSIRMKQAADLLSDQKLSVSEIAYALGFSNLSHFSNSFKEFYGMSPKEYAQLHFKKE